MTEEEHRWHAERLLQYVVEDPEYDFVHEDEELQELVDDEEATEDDWIAIHNLMYTAKATFTWDE